ALKTVCLEQNMDLIATAHHMEDQAETVLMHLMYGAGSDGLSGIKERQQLLWRPLLKANKKEIIMLLKQKNMPFCTDETNFNLDFTRNAIRNKIIPAMQDVYPSSVESISRCSEILSAENDFLQSYANEWILNNSFFKQDVCWFYRKGFNKQHIAIRRLILRIFYKKTTQTELNFEQTQRIIESVSGKQNNLKVSTAGENFVYITEERVHIIKKERSLSSEKGNIKRLKFMGDIGDGIFEQAFGEDSLEGAVLRFRQAGDRIRPLGALGSQTLKQYMIDKKIDQPLRDFWPILAKGSEVLWVIGRGISQNAAIKDNTTGKVFLRFESILPDGTKYKERHNK
ncbi:MAG: tRNA lysidine(34) synthetase TilS, partial [Eubacteriales bacterium]|nr:tRNA lysidine(34) synthetase TilS [Eubacteriales bacterium]